MSAFADVAVGDLFTAQGGRAKFIKDYIEKNAGQYPVYSASLLKPFGHVDTFDYDGRYLTWVMNGYGGRIQEVSGRFSATRDRGIFVPRKPDETPDFTYLRFMMELPLVASALGRRVDGRQNEYTKLYPEAALEVMIRLPLNGAGRFDYSRMARIGERLRRIEAAQEAVRRAQRPLAEAEFAIDVPDPSKTFSVGDGRVFSLSIGERVTKSELMAEGVPAYSANAITPFGVVAASNLTDFTRASLLWGIDGNFDWNLIPPGQVFATTDHCGRLQILDDAIDPEYAYWFLRLTRARYGFDRVYRANLDNIKNDVTLKVPLDKATGKPSLERQRILAASFRALERARAASLAALKDVLAARAAVESLAA